MNTYTAHATMRSGIAQMMRVSADSETDARRRLFRMHRDIASVTAPRQVGEVARAEPVCEFMRRAGDEVS